MNDHFMRLQRQKMQLESEMLQFQQSNEYSLSEDCKDVMQTYVAKGALLQNTWQTLIQRSTQLRQEIISFLENSQNHNSIQQKKLENLSVSVQEIENHFHKIYKIKFDRMRQEKDKIHLFSSAQNKNGDDKIGLLIDQNNSINNSNKLVEESLQVGQEVLLSFDRQSNQLKRIQNKLNTLIGDMGLSQGIIKLIGSRDVQDRRIMVILLLLLFLFIGVLYYYY